jgi:hypothetical protein
VFMFVFILLWCNEVFLFLCVLVGLKSDFLLENFVKLHFYYKVADYSALSGYLFIPIFYQTNAHTPIFIYIDYTYIYIQNDVFICVYSHMCTKFG